MIVKIDHIGIAVNCIEDTIKLYSDVFGLKAGEIKVSEEQKVKVAMIPIGDGKIELLEPTEPGGGIAKYIEKKGEGLHHLALEVSNIRDVLEILKKKGIPLIDMEPKVGADGSKIAFLHPKGTKVLIELVEY